VRVAVRGRAARRTASAPLTVPPYVCSPTLRDSLSLYSLSLSLSLACSRSLSLSSLSLSLSISLSLYLSLSLALARSLFPRSRSLSQSLSLSLSLSLARALSLAEGAGHPGAADWQGRKGGGVCEAGRPAVRPALAGEGQPRADDRRCGTPTP
jgi:hypothetical protein